jgi:hypothetical protein
MMNQEAISGWWDRELFSTFQKMIRESISPVARRDVHQAAR